MSKTPLNIDLPVGSRRSWELENTLENDQLHSVAESAVLVRSLRQSRERWLLTTFPKFSTKARANKGHDAPPPLPPHTIQTRGGCDVEIGPHVFPDTIFYEVHYLPSATPAPSTSNAQPYRTSWQTTTPYGSSCLQSVPTFPANEQSTMELTTVTPALINQVNSAASSNPILANLLQLAAAGKATKEELKTLGLLIQSLASRESAAAAQQQNSASLPSSLFVPQPPVKPFDIVIEFRELPNERYLFPRGSTVCERVMEDILVTTCIPFKNAVEAASDNSKQSTGENGPKQAENTPRVAKLRLKNAPLAVWDTLYRWVGGDEEMMKHREYLQSLKSSERVYLGYQLFSGSLLSQLQAVSTNIYPMKFIKPSQYSSRASKKRSSAAVRKEIETPSKLGKEAKQRRRSQPLKRAPSQILCQACGNTDVPLIQGGRYCRPCVDSGKVPVSAVQIAPQAADAVPTKPPVFIHSNYSSRAQNNTNT